MKIIPLGFEGRQSRFTHKIIVDYSDIPAAAAGAAATLQIFPSGSGQVPAGTMVLSAGFQVITKFDGGATSELTLAVGDGGDVNRFIVESSVHADATAIMFYIPTNGVASLPYVYAAADGIDFTFVATGANTNTLTQGQVEIYLELVDMATLLRPK